MRACITLLIGVLLLSPMVSAQVPQLIRYQGTLVDANNVPLEGNHTLTFRVFNMATGGSATWTETQSGVPVSRGTFNVLLGQVTPLTVAFEKDYWLSVQVDADGEMSPRQQLTSVPYAYRAKVAEALDTNPRFAIDNTGGLSTGLVAYWKMDEASGTRKDSKGTNSLTDQNTLSQTTGKAGKAAQFTAANSEYLSIADNADLSTGNVSFTISAWVYLASDPANDMTIVSKHDEASAGSREYLLTRRDDDRFVFVIYGPDGALSYVVASAFVAPGTATWHFVVAWHDADTNTVNIQVNNGAVSSSAANANGPADTAASFRIGAERSTPVYFWDGRIDEAGFWKRVLTAQERADLYNGGNGNTYGAPPAANPSAATVIEQPRGLTVDTTGALTEGLIAYWSLEEAGGTRNDQHGAHHLADNNTVTQAAGKVGQAGQFANANNEYLSRADHADLSTGDMDFTIAEWVYLDNKDFQGIAAKGSTTDSTQEWMLWYDSVADRFRFAISTNGTNLTAIASAGNLGSPSTSTWYFIVAWHDSVNDLTNIQVNNGPVNVNGTDGLAPADRAGAFEIGRTRAVEYFNGRIDEVGFWKRVLTAQERTDLYNAGTGNVYQFGGFFMDSPLTGKRHRLVTEELP